MAVSRDRVILTTPIPQATLKGWYVDSVAHIDLGTRRVTGTRTFYNAAGQFVRSLEYNTRISQNRRDNLVADIIADIIAQDATQTGVASVETVNDYNDPIVNP